MKSFIYSVALIFLTLCSCSKDAKIPTDAAPVQTAIEIYPDYTGITIPYNIAPLNFLIKTPGTEYVVQLKGKGKEILAKAGKNGIVQFQEAEWRELLTEMKGATIECSVYVKSSEGWHRHPSFRLQVAEEPIDQYISYRLIEPGYELYRQLGLYQRDISSYSVEPIYENNRTFSNEDNHCVNCHNFQNYKSGNMLFHVRAQHGGTVIAINGKVKKLNMKSDSILSSTVYPSWHPKHNWIAFSSNQTGQAFHLFHKEKVEVLDTGSDLVFYDADKNVLKNILKTEDKLETFPAWSPSGDKLYYCCADAAETVGLADTAKTSWIVDHYDKLYYNVMSLSFDERTQTFGQPQVEFRCADIKKSASVPRVSPDGRYLLFTLGDYGQFHIWHKSADLYIKDLQKGEVRKLKRANSPDVDSYHTWSSNGRWIVFSSRRDDGNYTRLYITYFDKNGRDHKAFILPQEDPTQNLRLLKSYNVPEMTTDKVPYTAGQFKDVIYNTEGTPVTYRSK